MSNKLDNIIIASHYVDMNKHIDSFKKQNENILELINALNDPTRQNILMIFQGQKEYCVNDIVEKFKLSRPTISHHLNLMKRSKVLNSRKEGKEIFFSFNKEYVVEHLEVLVHFLKGCC